MKKTVITYMFVAAGAGVLLLSCKGREGGNRSEDVVMDESYPLPVVVNQVVEAVSNGDAHSFAGNISYPLVRPYPLRNIEDSVQMVAYYPILVDDSLRNVVAKSDRKDWSEAGWRGWTLDAGQYLWIDEKVYAIPYLSATEKAMLDVAIARDMETLAPDLRKGWSPEYCLVGTTDGTLYRVDHNLKDGKYRMLVYNKGTKLGNKPSAILQGEMSTEGTEANRVFTFRASNGDFMEYLYDDSGEGASLTYTAKGGKERNIDVTPVYWLDYASR